MLCSWHRKGKLSGRLPQVTTVCQLFPALFGTVSLIFYKWGFQSSKNSSSKFCEVRSPYQHSPVWATLTWFTVKAEHAGSQHLIYSSVPACPGLAGPYNKRGWWQSSFPENVLLKVSLLGKYSLANIYSTFDQKQGSKCAVWTGQRTPWVISMCVFLGDRTLQWFTSDFWQSVHIFTPALGLRTQFLSLS